jgi:hypothetical protein
LAGAREHGIDPSDSRLIMSGRPSSQRAPHVPTEPPRQVDPIGFLPLPQFPIYALILALESLRIANQNAGRWLLSGHLFGVDGAPVPAGNRMTMRPERAIAEVPFCPTVIVCAGKRADRAHHPRPARGCQATLHWEAIALFREHHPEIRVDEQLDTFERNRMARRVRAMEDNIELPLGARERFGERPMSYYRVAAAGGAQPSVLRRHAAPGHPCGFSSPSVPSRTFRAHFGLSPRAVRSQFSGDQLSRFRPEIRQQLSL